MAGKELRYALTPTQKAFAKSEAVVNVIYSNTGEGKTFACVAALIEHVKRCGVPIRVAIVRDTLENLKSSVVISIQDFFQNDPSAYRFSDGYKKLTIFTKPHKITADLFGIDDLGSLGKLQGPEYALIWLNEPAPIADADRVSAGLSEDVFKAALVRCARQKGTRARLQVDMNPADQDHWTYRRFIEEEQIDPDNPLITKAVFRVPYGENIHANEVSRQAVRAAYKGDDANYARYVLGQFAKVYKGPAVTPSYNEERHLAKGNIIPSPGLVSFAFFDSWSNPSCVLGQITQYNRLIFIDTVTLEGSDIETLLETQVIPLLESPRWKGKAKGWRVGGDRTMLVMDQSNKLESAARKVSKYFGCYFDPGPQHWSMIQNHINRALTQSDNRGEPMILISADNKVLHKGLNGGWHYHINNQGKRTSNIPVKDELSHPCDAWANAVCVLLPSKLSGIKKHSHKAQFDKIRRRAQSYATGGGRM